MNIKKNRLELHSVIKIVETGTFVECLEKLETTKEELLSQGAYSTSPVIHRILEKELEKTTIEVMLQINGEIPVEEGKQFRYYDHLVFSECLYTRYFMEEYTSEEVFSMLEEKAKEEKILLETPYLVTIPIPGGQVIDVYAPIRGELE